MLRYRNLKFFGNLFSSPEYLVMSDSCGVTPPSLVSPRRRQRGNHCVPSSSGMELDYSSRFAMLFLLCPHHSLTAAGSRDRTLDTTKDDPAQTGGGPAGPSLVYFSGTTA